MSSLQCRHGDLESFTRQADAIHYPKCNAGLSHDLFQNPRYSELLRGMGLMPETAFACAFWFLFSPSEAVRSKNIDVTTELASVAGIKIGIQIRANYMVSDDFAHVGATDLSCNSLQEAEQEIVAFAEYFKCAQILEDSLKSMGLHNVKWFLISDSAKLRNCAATKYAPKLIGHRHHHRHLEHIRHGPESAIIDSVGDHLALAMTDFIIAKHGGFGRTAALIHNRWHSYCRLPGTPASDEDLESVCRSSLSFEQIAAILPGVR